MKSTINTGKNTGQKAGVDYLRQAYGYSYRQALSMYRKIEYKVAQKVNTIDLTAKQFQSFVTRTITGSKNTKVKTYIHNNNNIDIVFTGSSDEFKSEVQARLKNFIKKYKNTSINVYYNAYMSGQLDYETFKDEIENFKRSSKEYLAGS